jgi:hypothetical protein
MSYKIQKYTFDQAKKLGVDVKPSKIKNKKIDVIKQGIVIASIGDKNYKDFPSYIQEKGLSYANERRRLYKIRHNKTRKVVGSNSYYADKLLW